MLTYTVKQLARSMGIIKPTMESEQVIEVKSYTTSIGYMIPREVLHDDEKLAEVRAYIAAIEREREGSVQEELALT